MGSFSSAASSILSVAKAINSSNAIAKERKALDAKNKQIITAAEQQKQKNLLELQQSNDTRLQKLNRAIASQRAKFGSMGIGSNGGSSDAVVDGLISDSERDAATARAKTDLDNQMVTESANTNLQLNLLQQQQLRQKSRLAVVDGIF